MMAEFLCDAAPQACSNEDLGDRITELAAHLNAASCRFLELVGEFDRRRAWAQWGIASCAHWLCWKCGIGLGAAGEKVRVARRLVELPRLCEAFRSGVLSYSKMRAVTRVATPENEEFLLRVARTGTASHLERLCRERRRVERAEDESEASERRHASRALSWWWDDDGSLVLKGRLSPEDGALLVRALEAARDVIREEARDAGEGGGGLSAERSDALMQLAESWLARGPGELAGGERHQVIVHVDAATLADPETEGRSAVEGGPRLCPETARRLACDASRVSVTDGGHGEPLSIGRRSRTIPSAIGRALRIRDGGCRFPGCQNRRFVDGHHIRHWASGGETSLDNLVLLCRRHHRLVHEGGFEVARERSGELRFRTPEGCVLLASPPLPTLAPGAPERLAAAHRRRGLDIGPTTTLPGWRGESMDYTIAHGILADLARAGPG
ncbi:MAG: DUF222 domain-containing protein [Deltaproteobacteria bacterium]|nr:DUF222 domain-containing protein [Deltaproteobacteria bacterium]MCB9785720.1 DUF222 domain-containing protein [Deltaproteobacteria bacterium]